MILTISIIEEKDLTSKSTKILADGEEFKGLSVEAIIFILCFRENGQECLQNNWIDKDGRVFIYFTVEEIMRRRNISSRQA